MKKIFYYGFVFIVLLTVIVNLFSILHLPFFGYRLFRVGSGSMRPYLKVNDFILVQESNKYKVDDVITYKISSKEFVTHRIVKVDTDTVITRGDANNIDDDPIKKDRIVGKVVMKLSILGFILYMFQNPISWIILFIFGLLITMLSSEKEEEEENQINENKPNKRPHRKKKRRKKKKPVENI